MGAIGFDAGSIEARATLDRSAFDRDADAVEERGKRLEDRKLKIQVDADTTVANAKLDETEAKTKALGDSSGRSARNVSALGGGIGLLGTAIVASLPLLPELSAGIVALGGVAAAAGGALAGFGAVALTNIEAATQATQKLQAAQNAVDGATTPQARADALIKQKALIDSLGPATIAMSQALNGLSGEWKSFAAGFTPELTRDITAMTGLLKDAFPLIQPIITAGAGAVSTILSRLDTALQAPAAKSFFGWLAGTAEHDILGLATAVGGFVSGIGSLFQAFAPIETLIVNGLAGMGHAFSTWAANLSSTKGFQDFLRYVAANGPLLTTTLGDIVMAAGHILAALTPLLPPMLHILDFFAQVISNTPVWALTIGVTLTGALWLLNGAVVFLTDKSLFKLIPALWGAAAGETAMGTAGAGAAVGVNALGDASLLAGSKLGNLLKLLGIGSLADFAAVAGPLAIIAGGSYLLKRSADQANAATTNADVRNAQAITGNPYAGLGPDITDGHTDTITLPGGIQVPASNSLVGDHTAGNVWTTSLSDSDRALAAQAHGLTGGPSVVGDQTSANRASTFNSQVPGSFGSYFGSSGYDTSGAGTGDPPAFTLPYRTPSGGGGSAAAAAAAATNAALLQLQGTSLGAALYQGVATGINPIAPLFSTLTSNLKGAAQSIAQSLSTMFTAAMQAGQTAAASLLGNITALPAQGSITNVTVGADGRIVSTPQSTAIGGLQSVLGTDQRWVGDINKARTLGLSPAFIAQFVQAGPAALATLDALVNGSPGDIAQINSLGAQISGISTGYGQQVAAAQSLGALEQWQAQLLAAVRAQGASSGKAHAAALNNTAAAAHRTAAITPPKGLLATGHRL